MRKAIFALLGRSLPTIGTRRRYYGLIWVNEKDHTFDLPDELPSVAGIGGAYEKNLNLKYEVD